MADKKKIYEYLPEVHQTTAIKNFFENTFEQLFTKANSESLSGYVGRRTWDTLDPTNNFIEEPTADRTKYSLEHVVNTINPESGESENLMFFLDFVNRLKSYGVNINRQNRLFESDYYGFLPPIDIDKFLNYQEYYWSPVGPTAIEITGVTDIFSEIVGQETYTSPNGVVFKTGMVVQFTDITHPTIPTLASQKFIVEGAGEKIVLINKGAHASASYSRTTDYDFGSDTVEQYELLADFSDVGSEGVLYRAALFTNHPDDVVDDPDYLMINRRSQSGTTWSRTNNWYHKSNFIDAGDDLPTIEFRARRNIIEFKPDVEIYEAGTKYRGSVTTVIQRETVTSLNGKPIGFSVNGIPLKANSTILINSIDESDRGKIYIVTDNSGSILLTEIGSITFSEGDVMSIEYGDGLSGNEFYFKSNRWVPSQSKDRRNTPVLFVAYDVNGIRLDDEAVYPDSSFEGTRIFGYKVGTGTDDTYLDFPLSYQNFNNFSEITFENFLESTVYTYIPFGSNTVSDIKGYYHYKRGEKFYSSWITHGTLSNQTVDDTYIVSQRDVTSEKKAWKISAVPLDSLAENIEIRINGEKTTAFTYVATPNQIVIDNSITISDGDLIEIKTKTNTGLIQGDGYNGRFSVPVNWYSNIHNTEISAISEPQFIEHFRDYIENTPGLTGDALGSNNFKDLTPDLSLAKKVIHSGDDLPYAAFLLSNEKFNIVESLRFNASEYVKYKNRFRQNLTEYIKLNDTSDLSNAEILEEVIRQTTAYRVGKEVFDNSFMMGFGDDFLEENTVVNFISQKEYPLSNYLNLDALENTLLVYLINGNQRTLLTVDQDYTLDYDEATITVVLSESLTPELGNIVQTRLYSANRESAQIPPTPSAMGMYPVYIPKIETDNTFETPVQVIVGHDGSRTLTSEPIADGVILEFEKRIYNAVKRELRDKVRHPDLNQYMIRPGKFRDTRYSRNEWLDKLRHGFNLFVTRNSVNFVTNEFALEDGAVTSNPFRWNYNPSDGPGHWRGFYEYYYDTQTPNTTPWEMLGFSEKPTWWEDQYGTDYTSSNTAMWSDLEEGIIRSGASENFTTGEYLNNNPYRRSGMVIPVDANGDIIAPALIDNTEATTVSGSTYTYDDNLVASAWKFGDGAPVENAWKYSESYPFAILEALYLSRPGMWSTVFAAPDQVIKSPIDSIQFLDRSTLKRFKIGNINVHGDIDADGNIITATGFTQFIYTYLKFQGGNMKKDFADPLRTVNVKLGHKFAGFVDEDTLSVFTDNYTPTGNSTSLLLPAEDIQISLTAGAYSSINSYTGVIIEYVAGGKYKISGYTPNRGFFNIIPSDTKSGSTRITVGGEPVDFSIWDPAQSYAATTIVKSGYSYYRAKVYSPAGTVVTDTRIWERLAALPQKGAVSAVRYQRGTGIVSRVDYRTEFETIQEVYDFLIGLGRYHSSIGYEFGEFDTEINDIRNWDYAAKQFLFWASGRWETGNTLRLSPLAGRVRFSKSLGQISEIKEIDQGQFSLLDESGRVIRPEECAIIRENNSVEIIPPEGRQIFGTTLYTNEIEHVMLVNNVTIFNDTIFDVVFNNRQDKLKVKGKRTADWTGRLSSEGFIVTDTSLKPNYDNLAETMGRYNEIGFIPVEREVYRASRAQYGYSERKYLRDLNIVDDAQYEFYKGMIFNKGTKNSLTNIVKSRQIIDGEIEIYDEWALKLGNFGDVDNQQRLEVALSKDDVVNDPQLVTIVFPEDTTGVVEEIKVLDSSTVFFSTPTLEIEAPQEAGGIQATADIVLDANGRISSAQLTNRGFGYSNDPAVTVALAEIRVDVIESRFLKVTALSTNRIPAANISGLGNIEISDNLANSSMDVSLSSASNILDVANIIIAEASNNNVSISVNTYEYDTEKYISNISGDGSNVTVSTGRPHNYDVGIRLDVSGSGVYDGNAFTVSEIIDENTFKYLDTTIGSVSPGGIVRGFGSRIALTGSDFTLVGTAGTLANLSLTAGRYQPKQRFAVEIGSVTTSTDIVVTVDGSVVEEAGNWTFDKGSRTEINTTINYESGPASFTFEPQTYDANGSISTETSIASENLVVVDGEYPFIDVFIDGKKVQTNEENIFSLTNNGSNVTITFPEVDNLPDGRIPNGANVYIVESGTIEFDPSYQGDLPGKGVSVRVTANDPLVAILGIRRTFEIVPDVLDDNVITVDVDDSNVVLFRPSDLATRGLWPSTNNVDGLGITDKKYDPLPNAGFMSADYYDYSAFDLAALAELFNYGRLVSEIPGLGDTVHIAKNDRGDWGLFTLSDTGAGVSYIEMPDDSETAFLYSDVSLVQEFLNDQGLDSSNAYRFFDQVIAIKNDLNLGTTDLLDENGDKIGSTSQPFLNNSLVKFVNETIISKNAVRISNIEYAPLDEYVISSIQPAKFGAVTSITYSDDGEEKEATVLEADGNAIVQVTANTSLMYNGAFVTFTDLANSNIDGQTYSISNLTSTGFTIEDANVDANIDGNLSFIFHTRSVVTSGTDHDLVSGEEVRLFGAEVFNGYYDVEVTSNNTFVVDVQFDSNTAAAIANAELSPSWVNREIEITFDGDHDLDESAQGEYAYVHYAAPKVYNTGYEITSVVDVSNVTTAPADSNGTVIVTVTDEISRLSDGDTVTFYSSDSSVGANAGVTGYANSVISISGNTFVVGNVQTANGLVTDFTINEANVTTGILSDLQITHVNKRKITVSGFGHIAASVAQIPTSTANVSVSDGNGNAVVTVTGNLDVTSLSNGDVITFTEDSGNLAGLAFAVANIQTTANVSEGSEVISSFIIVDSSITSEESGVTFKYEDGITAFMTTDARQVVDINGAKSYAAPIYNVQEYADEINRQLAFKAGAIDSIGSFNMSMLFSKVGLNINQEAIKKAISGVKNRKSSAPKNVSVPGRAVVGRSPYTAPANTQGLIETGAIRYNTRNLSDFTLAAKKSGINVNEYTNRVSRPPQPSKPVVPKVSAAQKSPTAKRVIEPHYQAIGVQTSGGGGNFVGKEETIPDLVEIPTYRVERETPKAPGPVLTGKPVIDPTPIEDITAGSSPCEGPPPKRLPPREPDKTVEKREWVSNRMGRRVVENFFYQLADAGGEAYILFNMPAFSEPIRPGKITVYQATSSRGPWTPVVDTSKARTLTYQEQQTFLSRRPSSTYSGVTKNTLQRLVFGTQGGIYGNGFVGRAGKISWTHNPSGGKYYKVEVDKRTPGSGKGRDIFQYMISYPANDAQTARRYIQPFPLVGGYDSPYVKYTGRVTPTAYTNTTSFGSIPTIGGSGGHGSTGGWRGFSGIPSGGLSKKANFFSPTNIPISLTGLAAGAQPFFGANKNLIAAIQQRTALEARSIIGRPVNLGSLSKSSPVSLTNVQNTTFNTNPTITITAKKKQGGQFVPVASANVPLCKPTPEVKTCGFKLVKKGDSFFVNGKKVTLSGSGDPEVLAKELQSQIPDAYVFVTNAEGTNEKCVTIKNKHDVPMPIREGCAGGVLREVLDFSLIGSNVLCSSNTVSTGGNRISTVSNSVSGVSTYNYTIDPVQTTGSESCVKRGTGYQPGEVLRVVGGNPEVGEQTAPVDSIQIIVPGSGYAGSRISVTIGQRGEPGSGAIADINNIRYDGVGGILSIPLISGGSGYAIDNPPTVIVRGAGRGVRATARLSLSTEVEKPAKFQVESVDSDGGILSLRVIDRGRYRIFPSDLNEGVPLAYDVRDAETGLGTRDSAGAGVDARVFLTSRTIPDCSEKGTALTDLGIPEGTVVAGSPLDELANRINDYAPVDEFGEPLFTAGVDDINPEVQRLRISGPNIDGISIDDFLSPGLLDLLGIPRGDYNDGLLGPSVIAEPDDSLLFEDDYSIYEDPEQSVIPNNGGGSGDPDGGGGGGGGGFPGDPGSGSGFGGGIGDPSINDPTRGGGDGDNVRTIRPLSVATPNGDGVGIGTVFQYELRGIDGESPVLSDVGAQKVRALVLESLRFANENEVPGNLSDYPQLWLDDYQGNGWAYLENGVVIRRQEALMDVALFRDAFVYDNETGTKQIELDFYDPFKGIIPGFIDREITYRMQQDPVVYDPKKTKYGKKNVGETWWDTSTVRYYWYEQGSGNYAAGYNNLERWRNWGRLFPGSRVDIYEWVESTVPPSEYTGSGIPKNDEDFIIERRRNNRTGSATSYYYFWVRSLETLSEEVKLKGRKFNTATLEQYLTSPRDSRIPFIAPISPDSFIISGVDNDLQNEGSVVLLEFNRKETSASKKHSSWKLVRENDSTTDIPSHISTKIIDSLAAFDAVGNPVPQPRLSGSQKYGIEFRPRQTMFKTLSDARREMFVVLNDIFREAQTNVTHGDWLSQFGISSNLISNVTWFAQLGIDAVTNRKIYYDSTYKPLRKAKSTQEMKLLKGLYDGTVVQVQANPLSEYTLYEYSESTDSFKLIAIQNGTVRFKQDVFKRALTDSESAELRKILITLRDSIFTGTGKLYWNKFAFQMIKFAYSEQDELDWAFKTTYLTAIKRETDLVPFKGFRVDNFEKAIDYFNEAKPYSSKIREYIDIKSPEIEVMAGSSTDFDRPPYFDAETKTIRILDGDIEEDANILNSDPAYAGWISSDAPVRTINGRIVFDRVKDQLYVNSTGSVDGDGNPLTGYDPTSESLASSIAQNMVALNTATTAEVSNVSLYNAADRIYKFNPHVQAALVTAWESAYGDGAFDDTDLTTNVSIVEQMVSTGNLNTVIGLVKTIVGGDFRGKELDGDYFDNLVPGETEQTKYVGAHGWDVEAWDSSPFDQDVEIENFVGIFDIDKDGPVTYRVDGETVYGFDGVTFKKSLYGPDRPEELVAVEPLESLIIDVTTSGQAIIDGNAYPVSASFQTVRFVIFQDLFGITQYLRRSNEPDTALSRRLYPWDDLVYLDSTENITPPTATDTGVVWINGERIEFKRMDDDEGILLEISRGTRGTSVQDHPATSDVYDGPNSADVYDNDPASFDHVDWLDGSTNRSLADTSGIESDVQAQLRGTAGTGFGILLWDSYPWDDE